MELITNNIKPSTTKDYKERLFNEPKLESATIISSKGSHARSIHEKIDDDSLALLNKRSYYINLLMNIDDDFEEDELKPSFKIKHIALYILNVLEIKTFQILEELFANPYGTIELTFINISGRELSLEIGENNFNYFYKDKNDTFYSEEGKVVDIGNYIQKLNRDILSLSSY